MEWYIWVVLIGISGLILTILFKLFFTNMKWEAQIKIKDFDGRTYDVQFMVRHFDIFDIDYKMGCFGYLYETSEEWVRWLAKIILLEEDKIGNYDYKIIENKKINPHYRLNPKLYSPIWIDLDKIESILYEIYHVRKNIFLKKRVLMSSITMKDIYINKDEFLKNTEHLG